MLRLTRILRRRVVQHCPAPLSRIPRRPAASEPAGVPAFLPRSNRLSTVSDLARTLVRSMLNCHRPRHRHRLLQRRQHPRPFQSVLPRRHVRVPRRMRSARPAHRVCLLPTEASFPDPSRRHRWRRSSIQLADIEQPLACTQAAGATSTDTWARGAHMSVRLPRPSLGAADAKRDEKIQILLNANPWIFPLFYASICCANYR